MAYSALCSVGEAKKALDYVEISCCSLCEGKEEDYKAEHGVDVTLWDGQAIVFDEEEAVCGGGIKDLFGYSWGGVGDVYDWDF